jgi:CubicO group peptidase (beta-lactamase class C family)
MRMLKRTFQLIGVLALAGFIYLNISYWDDPAFWRRWWDTVTHLAPDYMSFSPTVGIGSDAISALPTAPADGVTVAPEALRAAEAFAAEMDSFGLIVVHRGLIQTEWYGPGWDRDRLTQSQSMMKSITAVMTGLAIRDGYIDSVDDRVGKYLDEWRDDPRGDITVRNLLQMSSGLAQSRFTLNPFAQDSSFRFLFSADRARVVLDTSLEWEPGSKFDYNDINAQIAGLIVERAVGRPYAEYLRNELWAPLGGGHAEIWLDREDGLAMTACCFLATPRDWAKVGLMMKDGGRFNGQQIVPDAWVESMITPFAEGRGYGYLTWLGDSEAELAALGPKRGGQQRESHDATDVFRLSGYGGQRVYVSREHDLVVVRLGPFAGMEPLNEGWDNSLLMNTIVRGLR